MLTSTDKHIAEVLKERLLQADVPLLELRVFGSRANGRASEESDMDVCLILSDMDDDIERAVSRTAWEVGYDFGRIITTVEYTARELKDSALGASPFIHAIFNEGVSL